MYARIIEQAVNTLRPIATLNVYQSDNVTPFDGTGLIDLYFYARSLVSGTAVNKIDGAACAVITLTPLVVTYSWIVANVDTIGRYATWLIGYYGSTQTIPQYFKGPELLIFEPWTRLTY